MTKRSKPRKNSVPEKPPRLKEPEATYRTVKKIPADASIPYSKFKRLMDKVPFTLAEWALILHLSQRTLQRYSKSEGHFEGIYADRIFHIQEMIQAGLDTFRSPDALYAWLHKEKNVLGYTLNFQALQSTQGIQNLINQLHRIQQGVYT